MTTRLQKVPRVRLVVVRRARLEERGDDAARRDSNLVPRVVHALEQLRVNLAPLVVAQPVAADEKEVTKRVR